MATNLIKNNFRGGIVDGSLSASIGLNKYNESCKVLSNFILQPQGGAYRRPGLKFITEPSADPGGGATDVQPTLVPFVYNSETAYLIALLDLAFKVYQDDSYIDNDVSFLDDEQNKTADYAQSADTLYLVHNEVSPLKIIRTTPTTFNSAFLGFSTNFPSPTGFTAAMAGGGGLTSIYYAITAITDDGEESIAASYVLTTGKLPLQWTAANVVNLTWNAVVGANAYNLYKRSQGIYGYIGTARGTLTFEDINYDPIISDSVPTAYNPFFAVGEFPGVVALFQQRLWFANSLTKPQTIFGSRIGQFENFNFSNIIREDDSIENTIYSGRVDGIRWLEPFNKSMKVGTLEKQWDLRSSSGGAITPTDIKIEPELEWGCSQVKPILAGNSLVYVEDKGSNLFDIFERQEYRGLTGNNLSVLAKDLFEGFEIVSMAYQRTPDPVIWCVRDDGKVIALTYLKNEDMWGWHQHETDGLFKNVVVLPGDTYDQVYFTIERVIQSVSHFYIEKLEDKWMGDFEDAKFLDSMVTKTSGTPFTEVTGLDHLEGEFVSALGDGVAYDNLPVISGKTYIPDPVTTAHVGLPYTSTLAPLSSEFVSQNKGASLGKTKTISDVTLRLKKSKGGKIGPRLDYLDELHTTDYDTETEDYTGDVKVVNPNKSSTDGSFFVVQDEPLPMTISALFINIQMGDR